MSNPLQNESLILISRPEPNTAMEQENFQLQQSEIDPQELSQGQFLVENLYISVDPTQNGWATTDTYVPASPLGEPMRAGTFGKVIESKNEQFQVGDYVMGMAGITKYAVGSVNSSFNKFPTEIVEAVGEEMVLPIYGLTGNPTAFVGMELTRDGMDLEGKVLLVSGAAGNVGQHVVQLGKHYYKMTVVGVAGSDEKCDTLVNEFGCDYAINYKTEDMSEALKTKCPNGIDFYFDNVGGNITDTALLHMNKRGRIAFCGSISSYTSSPWSCSSYNIIIIKSLRVQGFIVTDALELIPQSYQIATDMYSSGTLKIRTQILEGIDQFIPASKLLWNGQKKGKVLLKVQ